MNFYKILLTGITAVTITNGAAAAPSEDGDTGYTRAQVMAALSTALLSASRDDIPFIKKIEDATEAVCTHKGGPSLPDDTLKLVSAVLSQYVLQHPDDFNTL